MYTNPKEKIFEKNKQSVIDLQDTIKSSNIHIIQFLWGEEIDNWTEKSFGNIMAQNLPNLIININEQIQEAQQTQSLINTKKITPETHYNQTTKNQMEKENLEEEREGAGRQFLTGTVLPDVRDRTSKGPAQAVLKAPAHSPAASWWQKLLLLLS